MNRREFEKLVSEAIDALPDHIRDKMDNVAVVIEDQPGAEQRKKNGTTEDNVLLGLYEGVPQPGRGPGYTLVLPDKITIFKNSIEQVARTPDEIREEVKQTVWHEIAHHFGFSDDGIDELSRKRHKS